MKYMVDSHCHTIACDHAYSTLAENAGAAYEKNLQAIAITEHGPDMPGTPRLFYFENLKVLPDYINGVRVFKGAELNILDSDGSVDLPENICEALDITIASLHPPCYESKSRDENTRAMVEAAKKPYVKIIGHPTDNRFPISCLEVVKACKEYNTAIEINNSSFSPNSYRFGGESIMHEFFNLCKEFEVPLVIGSDAHFHEDIGNFCFVEKMIEDACIPEYLIANTSIENYMKIFNIR